ncbi:MAG: TAXI family TRAP transporter solute-binding subunit [Bacillota bacterium]|nr:TAXI family TRAP transporter solute-binding subunit [Bacillota bacterium]
MLKGRKIRLISLLLVLMMVFVGCTAAPAPVVTESPEPSTSTSEPAATSEPAPVAEPRETTHITIGTASVGGMNYPIGMALAQIWNGDVDGAKAVAIATNGSPHNIDLLRTNDIEAAVCRAIEANRAISGEAPYPEAMPWIRAITGGLFLDANQIVALKDNGIETIYDFKGKKIAVGPVGSGGEVDARETLAAHGITYDDIQPQYIEASQAIEMLEDGLIDGAILGLTMGSSAIAELMLTGKTVILPIEDEAFEKLVIASPYMQRRTLPANVYPNQDYEVLTAGSPPDHIIVRAEMDEQLVYEMTKAIYENKEVLQDVANVMERFGESMIAEESDMLLEYHDGTRRYFKEMGWIK